MYFDDIFFFQIFTEGSHSTFILVLPGHLCKFKSDLLLEQNKLHLIQSWLWCVYNIKYEAA
jgi:hypothetical protein